MRQRPASLTALALLALVLLAGCTDDTDGGGTSGSEQDEPATEDVVRSVTGHLLDLTSTEAVLGAVTFDHGEGRSETPGWVAFDESVYGEPVLASTGGGGDVGHDVAVAGLPESERAVAIATNRPDITAEDLLAEMAPAIVADEALPTPARPGGEVDPDVVEVESPVDGTGGTRFTLHLDRPPPT